jgi:hypothetical protein
MLRSKFYQQCDLMTGMSGGAFCRPHQFDRVGEAVNGSTVA